MNKPVSLYNHYKDTLYENRDRGQQLRVHDQQTSQRLHVGQIC
jgi:hypothetical protein